MKSNFKRLPDSELQIMLIIWNSKEPVTRAYIEERLEDKKLAPTTILSFLSRLEQKGFVKVERIGKNNYYSPLIDEESYIKNEAKTVLDKLYKSSIKKFVAALYDGKELDNKELLELRDFLDQKIKQGDK
ncbi:BlaI/MecI/CopY family transcriptional regulator [Acetivibrio clariflavus]|uniref:Putative transcriptional regulator n=1 Tax=Acetivibrio clariflavus (strain DSM 19732 / NBRC 101661 / EBR45) TaxID=720554 RepID=G8LXZ7_ACECE|nr:BlaI/MecI/CopY family transcriptional regulator [Acetivibrio clariflavus]AEV69929.1 putative transcriptional regulator [Acetivibrio clariflavus DSM 19732]